MKKLVRRLSKMLILTTLMTMTVPFSSSADAGTTQRCKPRATCSFIQSWMMNSWDDDRWNEELTAMKEAGIDHLILADTSELQAPAAGGKWVLYYPSKLPELSGDNLKDYYGDAIEKGLRACKQNGVKAYLGLGMMDSWWQVGATNSEFTDFSKVSAKIAKELYDHYYSRYSDVIEGWYIVPEIYNEPKIMINALPNLVTGFNTVLDQLTAINPKLPILMSPFNDEYYHCANLEDTKKFYTDFINQTHFRKGDIIAPQDAIGAGWTRLSSDEAVFKMYREVIDSTNKGVVLWANCEDFVQTHDGLDPDGPAKTENTVWATATLDRYVQQLNIASKYCDNIITFAWNHYYSPYYVDPLYNNTYLDYLKNGVLETQKPAVTKRVTTKSVSENRLHITWKPFTDNFGISYYRVYKNGKFIVRNDIQNLRLSTDYYDNDFDSSATTKYEIEAVDGAGNVSDRAVINVDGKNPNMTIDPSNPTSGSSSSSAVSSSSSSDSSSSSSSDSSSKNNSAPGNPAQSSGNHSSNPDTGDAAAGGIFALFTAAAAVLVIRKKSEK